MSYQEELILQSLMVRNLLLKLLDIDKIGMYAHDTKPIKLWRLPNTLAGGAAVTTFVQSVITWFIEMAIVTGDLRKGRVQPIAVFPEPESKLMRWYFCLPYSSVATKRVSRFRQALRQVARALVSAVILFFLLWPPTIGILAIVGTRQGNDYYYKRYPTPQIFSFLFGAILGLLQTPLYAAYWLLSDHWQSIEDALILPEQVTTLQVQPHA